MKVNLGSGLKYLDGYVNVDMEKNVKCDIVCDITKGLPFRDFSVDEILLDNVLEHLDVDLVKLIVEVKRVLKPNGLLKIISPNCFKWDHRINFLFGKFKAGDGYHFNHKWLFKPSFLKGLLEYYGFEVNKVNDLFDRRVDLIARKRT